MSLATTSPGSEIRPRVEGRAAAWVEVVCSPDGARVGTRAPLCDDLLLVGRDIQGPGLSLEDPRLSRVHARLTFDGRAGAFRIGDAQSRNGTFVNAERMETVLLSPDDVIRVGDTLLLYREREPMASLREQAAAAAPLPATVLLRGETGTGKELLARSIHEQSGRPGAFVPINCASVPPELMSAELFGHTRSAFSGASQARKGIFAAADGGTLFLDEIGDCPLPIQIALLRALQEKAVRPVGSEHELPVDVRVLAATHADLEAAIEAGAFRADLYARLAQITLRLPPLRERRAEIVALATQFARDLERELVLSADAAESLLCWRWPFNVRELQALIHGCFAARKLDARLGIDELREACPDMTQAVLARRGTQCEAGASEAPPRQDVGADRQRVRALLEQHAGNVSAVAQALGKPRAQVYRWMKALGLSAAKFRR